MGKTINANLKSLAAKCMLLVTALFPACPFKKYPINGCNMGEPTVMDIILIKPIAVAREAGEVDSRTNANEII